MTHKTSGSGRAAGARQADVAGERFPVEVEIPVLWGHMDALGHVNNTVFFRYFETARVAYFERVRLMGAARREDLMPILASTRCDFHAPLRYPDVVRCATRVSRLGRTSFTMDYRLLSLGQGAVAARGEGVVVIVDPATGRPIPIDEAMRAAIAAVEGTHPPVTAPPES